MRRPDHHLDRLVGVAEHGEGGLSRQGVLASGEHPRLAVGLERRHDLLGHLLEVGHLVEGDGVPDADKPHLAGRHVVEEVGDGRRPGQQDDVGGEFLVGVALARPPGARVRRGCSWSRRGAAAGSGTAASAAARSGTAPARRCGSAGQSTRPVVNWRRHSRYSSRSKVASWIGLRPSIQNGLRLPVASSSYWCRMSICAQMPPISRRSKSRR